MMPRYYSSCGLFFLVVTAFLLTIAAVDISSSFWLDETVTAWICNRELSQIAEYTLRYQGQSPLYFWLLWGIVRIAGNQEVFMRLPSVLAAALTLWAVYRYARRDLSIAASAASVLLLLAHGDFVRALLSARPYALALLFAVLAVSQLTRRIKDGDGLRLSMALAVMSFYFNFLIGISAAIIGLIYLLVSCRGESRRISRIEIAAGALLSLTLIPGALQLVELSKRGADYRFAQTVSIADLFKALLPLDLTAVLIIGAVATCCFMPKRLLKFGPLNRDAFVRAVVWMLVPSLFMIVLSLCTGNALVAGRYHLLAAPGAALLGGVLISLLREESAQLLVAAAIALLMLGVPRSWEFEPWREAAASIKGEDSLTLVSTGLIEAEREAWLESPENQAYLSAPFKVYPVAGNVLPISRAFNAKYFEQIVIPQLQGHDSLILVIAGRKGDAAPSSSNAVLASYSNVLSGLGFHQTNLEQLDLLTLARFSKSQE